jgi:TonB family protein
MHGNADSDIFTVMILFWREFRVAFVLIFLAMACVPCRGADQVMIPAKFKGIILDAPEPVFAEGVRKDMGVSQGVYRLTVNQQTGMVDEVGVLKRTGVPKLDGVAVLTFFKWKFKPGAVKQFDIPIRFDRYVNVLLKNAAMK